MGDMGSNYGNLKENSIWVKQRFLGMFLTHLYVDKVHYCDVLECETFKIVQQS